MRFLFTLILLALVCSGSAQQAPVQPPYLRFPQLPPLQLLLSDSATKYSRADMPKKKPVLLMLFSPDCSHCQHTAEELVARKKEWAHLHIVMATLHPLWQMNLFVTKYGLADIPNLVVGKDYTYLLPSFYGVHNLPYLAFYNRSGKLITGFEGSMPLNRILAQFEAGK